MHFLEQAAKALRHLDEAGILSALTKAADQTFEQPGPECVELLHSGHVDRHAAATRDLEHRFIHEMFERAGMRGGP